MLERVVLDRLDRRNVQQTVTVLLVVCIN